MKHSMSKILVAAGYLLTSGALIQGFPILGLRINVVTAAEDLSLSGQDVIGKGRERRNNFLLDKRRGLPQRAAKIRGTWSFTGTLSQTTCPENREVTKASSTYAVEQNEDVLYVTSGAGIEFFGDLGPDGEFALASSTESAPVSPSCTQEATLFLLGNFRSNRATFSVVNDLVGFCPELHACEFIYEGSFTRGRANGGGRID